MAEPDQRTLILLRHAKSSWADDSLEDFDRPLNKRGRRDAPRIGEWLDRSPYRPELALCSSAQRTRETWAGVAEQLSWSPEARFEDRLYHASVREIVAAVGEVATELRSICVVGHNPGIGNAMVRLATSGSATLIRAMKSKVPTGAAAVFRWEGTWKDVEQGTELLHFVVPRDLT